MRYDFENIPENAAVILHPADANLIHREQIEATRLGDCFYCEGSDPLRMGPDYYLGDIAAFCRGYEMVRVAA